MKIGKFIEELSKLDPNKNIWIYYDCYTFIEPTLREVDEEDLEQGVTRGDYMMDAW